MVRTIKMTGELVTGEFSDLYAVNKKLFLYGVQKWA